MLGLCCRYLETWARGNLRRPSYLGSFSLSFEVYVRKYSTSLGDDPFGLSKLSFEEVERFLDEHAVGVEAELSDRPRAKRVFRDWIKIHVKAGDGGKGAVSFLRARNKRVGPPSGGDGGAGGDIIFRAIDTESNLAHLRHAYRAENGGHGQGDNKTGRNGSHIYIDVPVGCLITEYKPLQKANDDLEEVMRISRDPTLTKKEKLAKLFEKDNRLVDFSSPSDPQKKKLIVKLGTGVSLDRVGAYFVAARGGRGGYGNARFATGEQRSPQHATPGTRGEEKHYLVELKLIADVGLIGFPNAGKSSLLAALSRAAPKIASYPFTTLQPQLGTIEYGDHHQITVTDLPGIIKFAHQNRGLGFEFLRHIERTKVLAFVVDMAGTEGRDPWDDFMTVRKELGIYQKSLLQRTSVIIANKMDLPEAKAKLRQFRQRLYENPDVCHIPVYAVSAKTGLEIEDLKDVFRDIVAEINRKNDPTRSDEEKFIRAIDLTPQFNAALGLCTNNQLDAPDTSSNAKTELALRKQSTSKTKSSLKATKSIHPKKTKRMANKNKL
jgi:GTP-binding protein